MREPFGGKAVPLLHLEISFAVEQRRSLLHFVTLIAVKLVCALGSLRCCGGPYGTVAAAAVT